MLDNSCKKILDSSNEVLYNQASKQFVVEIPSFPVEERNTLFPSVHTRFYLFFYIYPAISFPFGLRCFYGDTAAYKIDSPGDSNIFCCITTYC